MAEKIEIAKLEFDTSKLVKDAALAQEAFLNLKNEEDKLKESTSDVTEELIKNQAAQKKVKKEINDHTKAISELVTSEGKLADVTDKANKAIQRESKSIDGARKNNKELNAIRNKLDLSTEKGRKSLTLLNSKLDQNNKFIKENVDQYAKQKIGIGNYEEGITSALGKVNIFGVNLGSVTKSLFAKRAALQADTAAQKASNVAVGVGSKALKIFKIALISTGIGVLLIALGSLVAFFTGTQKGIQAIQKVTIPLKILFESLVGVFERVGETIFDAFTNPKQALNDLVGFIKGQLINRVNGLIDVFKALITLDFARMGDAMLQTATGVEDVIGKVKDLASETKDFYDEAIARAKEINDLENQIRALSASQNLIRAKLLNKIKEQEIISKSTLKTDKERLASTAEAERLSKGLLDFETEIINQKIKKLQLEQESNDTLIDGAGGQKELLDLFAELEVKKRESNAIEIKFLGVKNSILKKQQKDAEKVQKDVKKQIELDKKAFEKKVQDDKKKEDDEIQRLKDFEQRKTDLQNEIDLANEDNAKAKDILKIEQDLIKKQFELDNIQLTADEKLALELLLKENSEIALSDIDKKYKGEAAKREADLEQEKIDLRQRSFDAAVNLVGAETKLGKGLLAIKEIFALKESLIELRKLTFKSKSAIAGASLANAEGFAQTAKIGFPQNIPLLIGFAAQVGGIVSAIKTATSAGKSAKYEGGGLQKIGGKRHSQGGTKFWGEDGTTFEAEKDELIGVMSRTASAAFMDFNNKYSLGNSKPNYFAGGGVVTRSTGVSPELITNAVIEAVRILPAPIVDVKDIISGVNNRIGLVDGANV